MCNTRNGFLLSNNNVSSLSYFAGLLATLSICRLTMAHLPRQGSPLAGRSQSSEQILHTFRSLVDSPQSPASVASSPGRIPTPSETLRFRKALKEAQKLNAKHMQTIFANEAQMLKMQAALDEAEQHVQKLAADRQFLFNREKAASERFDNCQQELTALKRESEAKISEQETTIGKLLEEAFEAQMKHDDDIEKNERDLSIEKSTSAQLREELRQARQSTFRQPTALPIPLQSSRPSIPPISTSIQDTQAELEIICRQYSGVLC